MIVGVGVECCGECDIRDHGNVISGDIAEGVVVCLG